MVQELKDTNGGGYRICHGSSSIYEACNNQIGWNLCETVGLINYGEDTGCFSNSPNYTQIFEEISEWYYY